MAIPLLISVCLLFSTVLVHYEALRFAGTLRRRWPLPGRRELLLLIVLSLAAHIVAITTYAICYYWMHWHAGLGSLQGDVTGSAADFFYFSITSYTTLGVGDVYSFGPMRIVSALEGLAGLVMITLSASAAYASAGSLWERDSKDFE